jgi:hypothetical protein
MNCVMSSVHSTAVSREESIAFQLAVKGIYENGNYSIQPLNVGDYSLFTVRYRTSTVSPIFDDLNDAIAEFLKLTELSEFRTVTAKRENKRS